VHPRKCLPIGAAQIRLEQVARLLPRIIGVLRNEIPATYDPYYDPIEHFSEKGSFPAKWTCDKVLRDS
jgi:hypothetical protein